MKNLKIYCIGAPTTANWMRGNVCGAMEKADVVVFPGGADVNPKVYGQPAHPRTAFNDDLDAKDTLAFNRAVSLGKKLVGICRGAQFLCAKAGGKLVQDQTDIDVNHNVFTYDGRIITCSSAHHQAMFPWDMPKDQFQVLGWALGRSMYHNGSTYTEELVIGKVPLNMEVELAFFPGISALGIQPHPEWQYMKTGVEQCHKEAIDYYRILMDRFMDGDQFKDSSDAYAINA